MDALAEERSAGAERLAVAERDAATVAAVLRGDMVKAAEETKVAMLAAAEARAKEKAALEGEIWEAQEATVREGQRVSLEMARAVEEWGKEKADIEGKMTSERAGWRVGERKAAAELAEVRRETNAEMVRVRKSATEELEEAMRSAAAMLASAQEETVKEKEGRAEEGRLKVYVGLLSLDTFGSSSLFQNSFSRGQHKEPL